MSVKGRAKRRLRGLEAEAARSPDKRSSLKSSLEAARKAYRKAKKAART